MIDFWATGFDGARYPSVHGRVLSWVDVTGQQGAIPPPVNVLVVEVVCTGPQLDVLEADENLIAAWSEEITDET